MNPDFVILLVILGSIIGLAIAKTHIAFVILAICSGYVLSSFVGSSLYGPLRASSQLAQSIVAAGVMILPAVLVAYRFRKTQTGLSRLLQQLLPAIGLTLLSIVLVIDLLPESALSGWRQDSYLIGSFESFSPLLVSFAIAISLFDVLLKHADEPIRRKRGPGRPPKHG